MEQMNYAEITKSQKFKEKKKDLFENYDQGKEINTLILSEIKRLVFIDGKKY